LELRPTFSLLQFDGFEKQNSSFHFDIEADHFPMAWGDFRLLNFKPAPLVEVAK
jgi:hypothetical protein